jgi:hypothetical protein
MNANQILNDARLSLPSGWEIRDITTTKAHVVGIGQHESIVIEQCQLGPGPYMVSLMNENSDCVHTDWTCSWAHLIAMIGVWTSLVPAVGGIDAFRQVGVVMRKGRSHLVEGDRVLFSMICNYYTPEGLPEGVPDHHKMVDPIYGTLEGEFAAILDRIERGGGLDA